MRFVYEKEFVAQRSANPAVAVAELYRTRGLSTDTAVEAGYVVYNGLGVLEVAGTVAARFAACSSSGPGLDLAPRTACSSLARRKAISRGPSWTRCCRSASRASRISQVVAADINPRVVDHLRRTRANPPRLDLASAIQDSDTVTLAADYRDYFARLGRAIGGIEGTLARGNRGQGADGEEGACEWDSGARAVGRDARHRDRAPRRIAFDLIVATNILPYFDDGELMLAMSNIAGMLVPGGVFLHNEARAVIGEVTAELGLPFDQSRQVIIAGCAGGAAACRQRVAPSKEITRFTSQEVTKFHNEGTK